ncbi:hypothetical protein F383_11985 [Gossypium arboreum]|uniref:Uncharacterized protein n=1 Tax=Gossypium arboreum TaxID=29729 RepID=A0A0B0NGC7_GOSAR|nr:hypothetical protein F383_11985 [Gossypium arboreum]
MVVGLLFRHFDAYVTR